jgi:hypothetical protein
MDLDARAFFDWVVTPSYTRFVERPGDFSLLWGALVSMNTTSEHLGLLQRGYPPEVSRNERRDAAQKIRSDSGLVSVQICADVLKHVRIDTDKGTISSTSIDPTNPTTWNVGGHDLAKVAHDAFATLNSLSVLNAPST